MNIESARVPRRRGLMRKYIRKPRYSRYPAQSTATRQYAVLKNETKYYVYNTSKQNAGLDDFNLIPQFSIP